MTKPKTHHSLAAAMAHIKNDEHEKFFHMNRSEITARSYQMDVGLPFFNYYFGITDTIPKIRVSM